MKKIARSIYKYLLASVFFLVLFFAIAPGAAHAADRFWVGGIGNWSDIINRV